MRKTEKVKALEAERGLPIEEIVRETYNRVGTIRGAAAEVGVPHDTFYGWMVRLGIRIKSVAEPASAAAS